MTGFPKSLGYGKTRGDGGCIPGHSWMDDNSRQGVQVWSPAASWQGTPLGSRVPGCATWKVDVTAGQDGRGRYPLAGGFPGAFSAGGLAKGDQERAMPILMQGNAAIAEGALRAGVSFYAGYPITPSSEVAEIMARRLPGQGGIYLQMEDELASMAAIIGASLSGARSLTATSGPGFSLMQENLGMAVMAEVPCVVVNVQRSGPSTGLATRPGHGDVMQARWGRHGDAPLIALCPSSVQDCFDQTVRAFILAEKFRCPVVIMPDQVIAHLSEGLELPGEVARSERVWPTCSLGAYLPFSAPPGEIPPLAEYGSPYVFHVTSSMHDETGFSRSDAETARKKNLHLHRKIHDRVEEIAEVRYYGPERPGVLIVAYGITARAARAAARESQDAGVLELATLWPLHERQLAEVAASARLVLVAEMNLGQMVHEVRRIVRHCPVHGAHRSDGEPIEPDEIIRAMHDAGGEAR